MIHTDNVQQCPHCFDRQFCRFNVNAKTHCSHNHCLEITCNYKTFKMCFVCFSIIKIPSDIDLYTFSHCFSSFHWGPFWYQLFNFVLRSILNVWELYRCYVQLFFSMHFLEHTETHPGHEPASFLRHDVAHESDTPVFAFYYVKFWGINLEKKCLFLVNLSK